MGDLLGFCGVLGGVGGEVECGEEQAWVGGAWDGELESVDCSHGEAVFISGFALGLVLSMREVKIKRMSSSI